MVMLREAGVRSAILSPGSRSAPLALAAVAAELDIHVVLDERAAAFVGLGLSRASQRPVALICTTPNVMVVSPLIKAKTVAEFVALAKANPGKFNYASGGVGSSAHLSAELFKSMTGTEITHIPYKGSAPAVAALLADESQLMIGNLPPWSAQIKAGKVQALAVTTAKRHPSLPDVPALIESLPGFETLAWFGVLAPAATPKAVVERMNAVINQALDQADVKARLATLACDPAPGTPEAFAQRVNADVARWKKLASERNIRAD